MTNELGDRIAEVRYSVRLSQKDFAEKLGTTRNAISNYEIGRVEPKQLFLDHLCEVFNVNKEWLKTGEGDMFKEDKVIKLLASLAENENASIKEILEKLAYLDEEYLNLVSHLVDTLYNSQKKE